MRLPSIAALIVSLSVSAVLPACGGSGNPFPIPSNDITVTSTALPLTLTGQSVNYQIPLEGACPGPYVLALIGGVLPPGIFLDSATRSIKGVALQAGNYHFTVQIDATGCTPFATTTVSYAWNIGVGPVAIVLCDPAIIPVAQYNPPSTTKYTDVDGLKTTVFNQPSVFNFTVAGGTGPYVLDLIDDPADPDDNTGLPLGISIPPSSTSVVGSPLQVLPGGKPFRITLRATDALNQTGIRKFQWKIDTPPIIVATTTLPAGKCGTVYAQSIQIVDGVPPFTFEQTRATATSITYASPAAPTIVSSGAPFTVSAVTGAASNQCDWTDYPLAAAAGPYTGITPEGIYLDSGGAFSGYPRRTGLFTFYIHVYSTLVPNENGQHAFQPFTVNFANSEPPVSGNPAFSFKPATWTSEGGAALLPASPWSTLPELEVGVAYDPDGGVPGLQFVAQGGVPEDGLKDAPHFSQLSLAGPTLSPGEVANTTGYNWTINWDADSVGAPDWNTIGGGTVVNFNPNTGLLTVPNPNSPLFTGRGRTNISFTCIDQQLPTAATHVLPASIGRAAYSIGPDKVIITESTASTTGTALEPSFNDYQQTVRVLLPFSSTALVRDLDDTKDLAGALPSTYVTGVASPDKLKTLLSTIDLHRVTINPTTWRDDNFGLNQNGARPLQHGDPQREYGYSNPTWQSGTLEPANANAVAVDLAPAPTVTPSATVFKDGGQLYAFAGSGKFGVFIIRRSGQISVPVAFDTTSTVFRGFGDGTVEAVGANKESLTQTVQMTVSPDGRFGALKLKTNTSTGFSALLENAFSTKIVVFSLTGETPFAGATFKVIGTGSNGSSTTGGTYMYAASMALTNQYLYYLCGNQTSTYSSWKEHLIYRYDLVAQPADGSLLSPPAPLTGWINTTGAITNMMQTPFQKFENPTSTTSTLLGFNPTTFATISYPNTEMYTYDGWNMVENGLAPIPFRVSTDGRACAILAGIEPNTTSSTSVMNHDVWVDMQGTLRKLSTTPRHAPGGAGRGLSLARGPGAYWHWGRYSGPTTHFEISRDASKVAVVVNRQSASVSATSSSNWYNYREDIIAYSTTNSWASATEYQVTGGSDAIVSPYFGGSGTHLWRFGGLTFTADNNGLIFWAGRNAQNNTVSTTYENSVRFTGTFYSFDFNNTGFVTSIMPTADGGSDAGVTTFSAATPYNPTAPGGTTLQSHGRIRPGGGFISKSGDFLYVVALQAISASEQRSCGLVGINIRSLNTAQNINGKTDGRGFVVASQHARRGFMPVYYYYNYYALDYRYYAPGGMQMFGNQVAARNKSYVFYASHYQSNGPTVDNSTTSSFHSGATIGSYWGDYGGYTGQVEGFVADAGGPVQRITLASLGTVDSTVGRGIHWMEPSANGTALAFVYDTGGTSFNYGGETAVYLQKIAFNDTTGVLTAAPLQFVLPGGRVGDAMAIDSTGNKLFYAFGSGNENNKTISEVTFLPATNAISTRSVAGTPKRYVVLASGR